MLSAVWERLARDDGAGALEALLQAWRVRRLPELADLVERLSARLARTLPPVGGRTQKAALAAWLAVDDERSPASLPLLLPHLFEGSAAAVRDRLARMEQREPDPRIARAASEHAIQYWSQLVGNAVGTATFRLLARHGDGACVERLRASPFGRADGLSYFEWRSQRIARLEAALAPVLTPPPLTPDERALVERLRARLSDDAADALLSASPSSRLVAADLLLERGDPRGELIVLQHAARARRLTVAERRRIDALVFTHGASWIGPLARVLDPKRLRFDEGVLVAAATLPVATDEIDGLADAPEWSTVRDLEIDRGPPPLALLRRWPQITTLRVAAADVEPVAASTPPLAIEELHLRGSLAPDVARALADPAGLPRLRHLGFSVAFTGSDGGLGALARAPLGARLRQITIQVGLPRPEDFVRWATAAAALPALDTLTLAAFPFLVEARRAGPTLGALSATIHSSSRPPKPEQLAALVAAVPELASFRWLDPPPPRLRAPVEAALAARGLHSHS